LRDGRFIGIFTAHVAMYVDTDSSNYPSEGLENCTTCVNFVTLETKLYAAISFYNLNETALAATAMNVKLNNLKVIFLWIYIIF